MNPTGSVPQDIPAGAFSLRDVVAEVDSPRVARRFRRPAPKPGSGVSIIFSAVRKDDSSVDLDLAGTVAAGRGEICMVGVAEDMTEWVRDDARLKSAAASAKEGRRASRPSRRCCP